MQVRNDASNDWVEVAVKTGVKALVLLNLQSYAGGRDLWGLKDISKDQQKGWRTPIFNDGLIEVVQAAFQFTCALGCKLEEKCRLESTGCPFRPTALLSIS